MRVENRWSMVLAVVLLLVASACTSNGIDDGGGPNVVLEILTFNAQPIQGQTETGTCANNDPLVDASGNPCLSTFDCPDGEFCQLPLTGEGCQATPWSITFVNVPKTPLATTSPYNDIILTEVSITYEWANGFPSSTSVTPMGITVPADGTGNFQFLPISQSLLEDLEAYLGTGGSASASMYITFSGYVADSDPIAVDAGAPLELQNCLRAVEP